MSSSKPSSYDAFAQVDQLVSKPVLGSDGAASWQSFQKDHKNTIHRVSVAPKAPLKKSDKLGTGLTSWAEEVAHESQIRKEAGHAGVRDGYTTFQQKGNAAQEEATIRKKLKQMEQRIRPDDKVYYIPSKTFEGYKFDYIFTTRSNYGTGYFWDGMDSLRKFQRGETNNINNNEQDNDDDEKKKTKKKSVVTTEIVDENGIQPKKKKRKKKDKELKGPVILEDPNNPREQVAAAIRRKQNERLLLGGGGAGGGGRHPSLPVGWEATTDPSSNQTYYYCRSTGERRWDIPTQSAAVVVENEASTTTTTTTTCTTTTTGNIPSTSNSITAATTSSSSDSNNNTLPVGWSSAVDTNTGKTYYYQTNGTGGQTWNKPTEEASTTTTTTLSASEATATVTQAKDTLTPTTLLNGWQSAVDASSGKTYYYNATSGETRWEVPKE